MKKYIGTKQIEAEPMTRCEYNKYRGWGIPENENPDDAGYFVKYSDGYISWSPAEQFEKAYREFDKYPLGETALLMQSTDFKERFIAEYKQLKIRIEGLRSMLENYKTGTLKFKPKCSYEILFTQLVYMESYINVLEERAKIESINLAYADNPTTNSTLMPAT